MIIKFAQLYGSISLQSPPLPGRRHYGVPVAGPFDWDSHCLANALVGNEASFPTLELGGVTGQLQILEAGPMSWVGAGAFQGVRLFDKGDTLPLCLTGHGCRSYLGLPNGVRVLDGIEPIFKSGSNQTVRAITLSGPPTSLRRAQIRVIQSSTVADSIWTRFISGNYTVDSQSNRVGVRLSAHDPITHGLERPSEPVDVGVIQLPPSGHPIILGPDGPTIGGYPNIGSVIRSDLPLIAQLRPGSEVGFEEVDLAEASLISRGSEIELERLCRLLRIQARFVG